VLIELLTAAAAVLASWLGVASVKRWAMRHRVLDVPNERSSHAAPVPRGGGIAIVVTVIAASLLLVPRGILFAWIVGSLLIASVSWLDDLRSLPTVVRLLTHAVAAVFVIASAGPLPAIGAPTIGYLNFSNAAYVLTFLWIGGLTNAFNFMDGIDGIAGGQAAVAGIGAAIAGYMQKDASVEVIGLLIFSASIGFLIHNWSPATIFMGDVGSAFLGYSLAVIPLMSKTSRPEVLLTMVCALWPFLFDATFTFFRRLLRGENVTKAHRSHLYQRLVQTGWTHGAVALLYVVLAAIGAALGLAALRSAMLAVVSVISIVMMASALLIGVIIRERPRPAFRES
jgi:UDP-N-acetylmuramyl pentapeptide phosphotransferase/UDP-N-acetylglucosamine-1-phosphate transferase